MTFCGMNPFFPFSSPIPPDLRGGPSLEWQDRLQHVDGGTTTVRDDLRTHPRPPYPGEEKEHLSVRSIHGSAYIYLSRTTWRSGTLSVQPTYVHTVPVLTPTPRNPTTPPPLHPSTTPSNHLFDRDDPAGTYPHLLLVCLSPYIFFPRVCMYI